MIGQNNQGEQFESRGDMICRGTSSENTINPTQGIFPQVDVHTLEENIVSKVRSQVDNVMTSVETRVQDTVVTAVENLAISRVEWAIKSGNAPSGRSIDGNVLERDQREFLGKIEDLQMAVSNRINSRTDLNRIDQTRCNITVEEGDLLVNEKKY